MGFKYDSKPKADLIQTKIEAYVQANYDIQDYNKTARAEGNDLIKEIPVTQLRDSLKAEGLGYRYQDLLNDVRRHEASDRSLDNEARDRALDWYDRVFEPMRDKFGLNSQQASDMWYAIQTQSYELYMEMYDIDDIADFWDIYHGG